MYTRILGFGSDEFRKYWFMTDDMLTHYWGTTDEDALKFPLDAPDDKKATPLSVALGTGLSLIHI